MGIAHKKQNFLDWATQQWVILYGNKIDNKKHQWLLGPFGNTKGIGYQFIEQLAQKESLIIHESKKDDGLFSSINQLNLPAKEVKKLSKGVIDFYQNTTNYNLVLAVKWNPFFKGFGFLLKALFSRRIQQLNIPIQNIKNTINKELTNSIIHLTDAVTNQPKHTIWLRAFKATNKVVYTGIYKTCTIPSGQTCIKAIFPLPNGSATVVLTPSVRKDGSLILTSSGKKIGDSGFYFLLQDAKGTLWTKFIKSFKDKLVVSCIDKQVVAKQTFTLWNLNVLQLTYTMHKKQ